MSSDVHPTRTAEHGTYGRWRVARVQGYGIVAAAAACMPACSEGITAVIAPLGTVNQVPLAIEAREVLRRRAVSSPRGPKYFWTVAGMLYLSNSSGVIFL